MSRMSPPATGAFALAAATALIALTGVTAANAVPSASRANAPVIVEGVLYDSDGSRAGAGELVTLTAWPPSEVLSRLADGDPVPTLMAGVAVTDAVGGFAVRYSDPAALASYADADGTVDFTLDSEAGGVTYSFGLSRTVPASVARLPQPSAPASTKDSEPVLLRPLSGPAAPASRIAESAASAPVPVCKWIAVATLGNRWVQVGDATTTTGVTATFKYSSGGTSTIGVAASVSGTNGTFSASGTTTVSSSASVTMPSVTGVAGKVFRTQFVFKKFAYRCTNGIGDVKFQVRATSFAGGASALSMSSFPTATHCTPYIAGGIFDTRVTNASAQKWSGGASVSGDIGINLSAQSGFTSTVYLKFVFDKARNLCGTNANPPSAARLVAK